jgi:hypothetical protein
MLVLDWVFDWLINSLAVWLIGRLVNWLIGRLVD